MRSDNIHVQFFRTLHLHETTAVVYYNVRLCYTIPYDIIREKTRELQQVNQIL